MFSSAFILVAAGALLKIQHAGGADILLATGLIANVVFIITAVFEVRSSTKVHYREKILWTIALILGGTVAGLVYIVIGRRRIVSPG